MKNPKSAVELLGLLKAIREERSRIAIGGRTGKTMKRRTRAAFVTQNADCANSESNHHIGRSRKLWPSGLLEQDGLA